MVRRSAAVQMKILCAWWRVTTSTHTPPLPQNPSPLQRLLILTYQRESFEGCGRTSSTIAQNKIVPHASELVLWLCILRILQAELDHSSPPIPSFQPPPPPKLFWVMTASPAREIREIPNGLWLNNKSVFDCTGRFVFSSMKCITILRLRYLYCVYCVYLTVTEYE